MRIQTKSYKAKPKVVDKKKKEEAKDRKKTLNKEYESLKRYNGIKKAIKLKDLTYGIIDSTLLIGLKTESEALKIENSWIGAIIFMLSLLESLGDFENKLVEHGITTGGFIVDKNYGKIDFNRNYKAFNIYETGYYVELDNKYDIIFEAIVRLSKALGLDNLQFVIEGVKKEELSNTKRYNLRLKYLEKKHIEDIIGISINDTEYISDNLIGALTELCSHLDKDKIKSYKSTGFDKDSNKAYTDNSIRGIKKFIETNFSNIKIEFIVHIKSEWEI